MELPRPSGAPASPQGDRRPLAVDHLARVPVDQDVHLLDALVAVPDEPDGRMEELPGACWKYGTQDSRTSTRFRASFSTNFWANACADWTASCSVTSPSRVSTPPVFFLSYGIFPWVENW